MRHKVIILGKQRDFYAGTRTPRPISSTTASHSQCLGFATASTAAVPAAVSTTVPAAVSSTRDSNGRILPKNKCIHSTRVVNRRAGFRATLFSVVRCSCNTRGVHGPLIRRCHRFNARPSGCEHSQNSRNSWLDNTRTYAAGIHGIRGTHNA